MEILEVYSKLNLMVYMASHIPCLVKMNGKRIRRVVLSNKYYIFDSGGL